MLETLWIKNFALIAELEVRFAPGFNILTGETGAGKSIMIGALGLILGEKGDTSLIRTGCEEAVVTAMVSVTSSAAASWLAEHDIETDDGILIIKRSIRMSGRGSITIQADPVPLKVLRELSALLFDLHGQHEHQSLLRPSVQRIMLDRYGGIEDQVRSFGLVFKAYLNVRDELQSFQDNARSLARERDMLEYSINEIDTAQLHSGEDVEIEKELSILTQHERLLSNIEYIKESLNPQSGSLVGVKESVRYLEDAVRIDESLQGLSDRLTGVRYELEDVFEEIRRYSETIQFSSSRLDELQERLSAIRQLKKKYGDTIEDILTYREEAQAQLDRIEHRDTEKQELNERLDALSQQVKQLSAEITRKREATARKLEPLVMNHLSRLGMPNAIFTIRISSRTDSGDAVVCTANGADTVDFFISANLGEPEKLIRQTASGGELSRIMLALKTVFSEAEEIETLVFDEIDSGIGGAVAVAVGEHLQELSCYRQVLCISHLASVAAKADNHIVVEKREQSGRTVTGIRRVTGDDRLAELARMLSGSSQEEKALDHARLLVGSE